ncbi:hypothetical protein LEMLEM_LOCUS27171 [Lemmus lemmus]
MLNMKPARRSCCPTVQKTATRFLFRNPSHKGVFAPWTPAIQRYMPSGPHLVHRIYRTLGICGTWVHIKGDWHPRGFRAAIYKEEQSGVLAGM